MVACRRTCFSLLLFEVGEILEEGETVGTNFFFDLDTLNSGLLAAHSWLLADSMALFILPLNGEAVLSGFILSFDLGVLSISYLNEITL